jgi:hypothetical protein
MDGLQSAAIIHSTSVVIHDFNALDVPVAPEEAYAPLVVDANAVLADAIAFQCLKPVARRALQVAQLAGAVQILQLAAGGILDVIGKPPGTFTAKYPRRLRAPETCYHRRIILYGDTKSSNRAIAQKQAFPLAQAGLPRILLRPERQNGTESQNVKTNASSPAGHRKSNSLSEGLIKP